jgi:hypothetical protein
MGQTDDATGDVKNDETVGLVDAELKDAKIF